MNPYLQVIDALNRANVRYVVAGGFAALLHGNNRLTADLDVLVDLSPNEAARAIETVQALGYQSRLPVNPLEFADEVARRRWIEEKNMTVFSMIHATRPALVVDFFVNPPLDFAVLYRNAVMIEASGIAARVCGLADLIQMKTLSGRPIDLLDIANLRRIQQQAETGRRKT